MKMKMKMKNLQPNFTNFNPKTPKNPIRVVHPIVNFFN